MIRRPPRSTRVRSSAASDVYKRQVLCIELPRVIIAQHVHYHSTFAGHALEARWLHARCALSVRQNLSRRTYNEHRARVPRVSGVDPALPAHVRRPSGVYIYASSSTHNFEHVQKSRRTQRMATNASRWSSVLDERVTNEDEQRRTDHFQRAPRAFFMRPPGVTRPLVLFNYTSTRVVHK